MADTRKALAHLRSLEGGWVSNKFDDGGETYCGITKTWYPAWAGWAVIDESAKLGRPVPKDILDHLVDEFYSTVYGVPLRIADPRMPQEVANELLECAINTTTGKAVKILQRVLNALNRRATRWPDIDIDGRLGKQTMDMLEKATRTISVDTIVAWMNVLQGAYLMERIEADPDNEEFAVGWIKRVRLERATGG